MRKQIIIDGGRKGRIIQLMVLKQLVIVRYSFYSKGQINFKWFKIMNIKTKEKGNKKKNKASKKLQDNIDESSLDLGGNPPSPVYHEPPFSYTACACFFPPSFIEIKNLSYTFDICIHSEMVTAVRLVNTHHLIYNYNYFVW